MTIKLSDAQLVLISAASQREDRCLVAPQHLKGGAAKKVGEKLVGGGLAREVKAKAGGPVWRRDADGMALALKLTAAGLKAIAVDAPDDDTPGAASERDNGSAEGKSKPAPREGSKIATVIGLLQRRNGATLEELIKATGWQPHTTRAALAGLRKRSLLVQREKAEAGGASRYRVAAGEAPAAAA